MSDAEFRTQTLEWADVVMYSTFYVMQKYLTDVWKLSFTTAATSINIWVGLYRILPILFLYLADTILGNFLTLALSGIFSTMGLVLVTVMTRAGYKCNRKGEAECVGRLDMSVFIIGMLLIAIGRATRFASAKPFIRDQRELACNNNNNNNKVGTTNESSRAGRCWSWITDSAGTKSIPLLVIRVIVFLCIPTAAVFAFPHLNKYYFLFGASAVCTLTATFIFLIRPGNTYRLGRISGRSPVTDLLRVFVAAAHKRSRPSPTLDDPRLFRTPGEEFQKLSHSRCLGRLHKAAIQLEDDTTGGWTLCSVSEVESAKIVIRMVFVYTAFLLGGVVSSIGNTYFVQQALNMNFKIGHWDPPLQLIQILFSVGKVATELVWRAGMGGRSYNFTRINGGMGTTLFSIICCTVSAAVERRRVHAIRRRDLVGLPVDGMVHMGAYWLLFQILFLGFVEACLRYELSKFHEDEAPKSMKRYIDCLGEAVVGVGFMWGAFSVFAVSKVSGIGSSKSWFRSTLNKSRLDRYYWVLSVLCSLNLFWCIAVSLTYKTRRMFAPVPPEEYMSVETGPGRSRRGGNGRVAARTWPEVLMS